MDARNQHTKAVLGSPSPGEETYDRVLAALDSKDKIAYVSLRGAFVYNLWKDSTHLIGLWRRQSLEAYKKRSEEWETMLDLDALDAQEGENNWVWKGVVTLKEVDEDHTDLVLIKLSRGGADAVVVREFNLDSKSFVTGSKSFTIDKEAKTSISFLSRDVCLVGTDFGPGSLTQSGYPRVVKEWHRGTSLESAKVFYEGKEEDVAVGKVGCM